MIFLDLLLLLAVSAISAHAKPTFRAVSSRQAQDLPPCGEVIAWVKNDYTYFDAHYVYTCLRSVPFVTDVATRFLKYYNDTLQFHAPLDTLKSPPRTYQQPAVDVVQGLNAIQSKIVGGQYPNQYSFEADVQRLIAQMHDPHAQLNAGILAAFSFASPYGIISASVDGKELPGIYIDSDVVYSQFEGWQPSPIVKINGQDPVKYLMRYAEENAASYLEPHAEWNSLMESPVADILGLWSTFQQGTIYPGEENDANLTVELKNGTIIVDTWSAIYQENQDTGPLTTAGDFYNYFVLGQVPVGYEEAGRWWPDRGEPGDNQQPPVTTPFETNCGDSVWCVRSSAAFNLTPAVEQGELDDSNDELITGYILEDISTAVLSIPHFYSTGAGGYDTFRFAIQDLILAAQEKKAKRIIIDVQQNTGGSTLRAYDTFKLFFPSLEPYGASRTRKHEWAETLGNTYTKAFKDGRLDEDYASSEWVVSNRIHADQNSRFSSWANYFSGSSNYSQPQKYNLTDEDFDLAAWGAIPWGYDPDIEDEISGELFAADDIVILTDGLCGSACSLFVELMSHQGGVRTIAVGGRPETGPMQAASGSRGASAYSASDIDYDIKNVNSTLNDPASFAKLPRRTDKGMWTNYAGLTLRNQVRENDPTPLHFLFQAADCRIFYTLKNVYNMTRLWHDAAKATWTDSSLCVAGSTGYPSARNTNSTRLPPVINNGTKAVHFDFNPNAPKDETSTLQIYDGGGTEDREKITYKACPLTSIDDSNVLKDIKCLYMEVSCPGTIKKRPYSVAVPFKRTKCEAATSTEGCQNTGSCTKVAQVASKAKTGGNSNAQRYIGYCETNNPDKKEQYCVADVPATRSHVNFSIPKTWADNKCGKKPFQPKDNRVTKADCQARMRIFKAQTFALWTKKRSGSTPANDLGTCWAYTCDIPLQSELIATSGSIVYIWGSDTSAAIMRGLGD